MGKYTKVNSYWRKPSYIKVTGTVSRTWSAWAYKVKIGSLVITIIASSYVSTYFAGALSTSVVHASEKEYVYLSEKGTLPPVMKRIAKAESLDSHYCTQIHVRAKMCEANEIGQVLIRVNKDNTLDVGRYQINVYHWGKTATSLGLDIYDEKDNEAMAMWIYENYGTEPWYPSKARWK